MLVGLLVPASIAALLLAAARGYLTRPITRFISERLGRELAADGGLRVAFGSVIRIDVTGLRLANSAWAGRNDMLRVRHARVEIETRSVFRDTLVVRELTAEGLELQLARNAKGENNWTFKLQPHSPGAGLPVVFEAISIPNARLSFAGPRLEHPLEVTLASLEQQVRSDGMLALSAIGVANDTSLELQLTTGPFASLVAARNIGVSARGHLGELALGVDARIDSLAKPEDTDVSFSLEAPEAAYLASHLGLRDLGAGPVALALTVSRAPAGAGIQGRLKGQVGEFALEAQGSMVVRDEVPAFAVQANVAGPDLSRVARLVRVQGLPAESFRLRLDVQRAGGPLQVRSAVLELADARVEVQGAVDSDRGVPGSELAFRASAADIAGMARRFRLNLPLKGPLDLAGKLQLERPQEMRIDCRGSSNYGRFSASGPVQLTSGGRGTRLVLTAGGDDLAPLGTAFAVPDPPRGKFQGKGELEWARDGLLLRGVRIDAGGESLSITGSLGRPAFGRGADLQFEAAGPSAARMAARFGYVGLPGDRYHVFGKIRRLPDRWQLSGLGATLADATLHLDGSLGLAPGFETTNLAFELSGPALADYSGLMPDVSLPRGAFRAKGRLASGVDRTMRLEGVQLAVGAAKAAISAELDLPLARHSMRFHVDANVPEPGALLPGSALAARLGNHLQATAAGARRDGQWTIDELRLSTGKGLVTTQGTLTLLPRFAASRAKIELRAPSLRQVGAVFDLAWPELPVDVHAAISTDEHNLLLDALGGRLDGNAFTGQVAAHGLPGKPDLDVQLDIPQFDLDRYLKPAPPAKSTGSPAPKEAGSARGRVIPDTELLIPDLGRYTGKLALRVGSLRLGDSDLKDVQFKATMRNDRLQVDQLELGGPSGRVSLSGALARKGRGFAVQLAGTGSDLHLRPVPIGFGGPDASRFTASVDLQASGSRWRELAATLEGRVRLVGRGGRLKNSLALASSSGFVQQLIKGLNPMATSKPTTDVVCAVYLLRAKDGIVTTDPAIVMRTSEVDIVSAGAADLRSEKIDFNFKIRARTGLGFNIGQLVNPYLKVNGTLGNPGVTLDPTGALVNGGAAVATAGLSVVATTLWDRFVHESDPCGAAVAESDRRATQQPGNPAQP